MLDFGKYFIYRFYEYVAPFSIFWDKKEKKYEREGE